MATTYNTLSLESRESRKTRPVAAYLAAGLLVVALAGAGTFYVSSNAHASLAVNSEFDDFKADVVTCWSSANGVASEQLKVEDTMPKYDEAYPSKDADGSNRAFYNACYYSYSCCTEVSLKCLASQGYGDKCESCLLDNGPKMVLPLCTNFVNQYSKGGTEPEPNQKWGKDDIFADSGLPSTTIPAMKRDFQKKKKQRDSCWRRAGPDDERMVKFVKNCWDTISWCHMLCPRDDQNTVNEKMCKECINLGFQQLAPAKYSAGRTEVGYRTNQKAILEKKVAQKQK